MEYCMSMIERCRASHRKAFYGLLVLDAFIWAHLIKSMLIAF